MNALDKITKARISVQKNNPFWAYLVMHLKPQVMPKNMFAPYRTMGVDAHGNLWYDEKFVEKLSDEEVLGCILHETLHVAFDNLIRMKEKDHMLFNISSDMVNNWLLVQNGFKLPKEGIVPTGNEFHFPKSKIIVKDLDKKSAEEVYDELYKKLDDKTKKMMDESRWDELIISKRKEGTEGGSGSGKKDKDGHSHGIGKDLTEEEIKKLKEKWKKLLTEATTMARNQGRIPLGVERIIGELLEEKLNWKALLYKYITQEIHFDNSWARPSKRSQSVGTYLPAPIKEMIEVTTIIDTSGSISQTELVEFLSEIMAIGKSFVSLRLRIITADADVQEDLLCEDGNMDKILEIKCKGGGGTSFIKPLDHVVDNYPTTKIAVYFTDGFGDKINADQYPFKILWILCKGGSDEMIKDSGTVIRLTEE